MSAVPRHRTEPSWLFPAQVGVSVFAGIALAYIFAPGVAYVQIGVQPVGLRRYTSDAYTYHEIIVDDVYHLRTLALPVSPVILDIGAQIGLFSTYALALFPTAQVFAFEMNASNFERLQRNTSLVQTRIHPFLATVVGAVIPTGYTSIPWSTSESRVTTTPQVGASPIPTPVTIAQILASNGLTHVDLMKMDIEGAEYDVLSQALADGSLAMVDRIYMEWHDGRIGELVAMLSPQFSLQQEGSGQVGLLFATRKTAA